MRDFGKRQLGLASVTLVLLGLLGLSEAADAGTGRLLSSWMSRAPQIDGQIGTTEWSEAKLVDLGAGVTVRIGNDARTLYLAILDSGDLNYGASDLVYLYFDDEGGAAPVLDDGAWGNLICQQAPGLGEGQLHFSSDQSVAFLEYSQGTSCGEYQFITDRMRFHSRGQLEGVTYELAIPLDGPTALRAGLGKRFGVLIAIVRNSAYVACLPNCSAFNPPDFRNLILASGGCNTGPQDFGSGNPQIGLPLDWTREITSGSGTGWHQSGIDHEPELCIGNVTGGSGAAACVANGFQGSAYTESLLRMPLSLAGQTTVKVRSRATLVVDPNGSGQDDSLDFALLRQDGSGSSELRWQGQDTSGTIDLPLHMGGSPPVEFWLFHSTLFAGGIEGGFAQLDDVELLCGPTLFADDFDSGLTTHWSTTIP